MKQTEYMGVVEQDGHLSLPETVRAQMCLKADQIVRVTLVINDTEEPDTDAAFAHWRAMGRNARPGRLKEVAERHDEYLYGRTP